MTSQKTPSSLNGGKNLIGSEHVLFMGISASSMKSDNQFGPVDVAWLNNRLTDRQTPPHCNDTEWPICQNKTYRLPS